MALVAGWDIGTTSAWVALDEDSGEVAGHGEVEFIRDGQTWDDCDRAFAGARALRRAADALGTEVIAVMFEGEFMGRNPRGSLQIARRRGHLEVATMAVLGEVASDVRSAMSLRAALGFPRSKVDAHAALVQRHPEVAALSEHERDAFVAARVLFEQGLVRE